MTVRRPSLSSSFLAKIGAAAVLTVMGDWLFDPPRIGAVLGGFVIAWVAALAVVRPGMRRRRGPGIALAIAVLLGGALIDDPSLLGWVLAWSAIMVAALLPRHVADDAASWGLRLISFAAIGIVAPMRDALRLARRRFPRFAPLVRLFAVPVVGALVFVGLFASANPVIGAVLSRIRMPSLDDLAPHILLCALILFAVWPSLRPRAVRIERLWSGKAAPLALPIATLTLSLVTFNLVFTVQNLLDIAFLWSGAALPDGVTLADYAHRGAYPLIATALLAGGFVLVALRPGSESARSPLVRALVIAWIGQNVLLVASSILRTLDYIAAYSLTELRIAALAWMGLVAVGLALIGWRLVRGRSAAWLINANALAAGIVLLAASVVDFGAVAARWNVDHARAASNLDLCYLERQGASALLPLIDLERRAGGPILRDQARALRIAAMTELTGRQAGWRSWTGRGARRLAAARAATRGWPAALRRAPDGRDCGGAIIDIAPRQLTEGASR